MGGGELTMASAGAANPRHPLPSMPRSDPPPNLAEPPDKKCMQIVLDAIDNKCNLVAIANVIYNLKP